MKLSNDGLRDEPEIGLVPLIDVILTLIIFFVVTTTFENRSALKVALPEASVQSESTPTEALLIVIDEQGRYYVGANEVLKPGTDALREAIQNVAGDDRERAVALRADARAPWQSGVSAMDVLGQLGFDNVSIATVSGNETPAAGERAQQP